MSEASKKGESLEKRVAKVLREKLRVRVHRDSRSGAGVVNKSDINDWYRETRLAIEAKAHKTLAIKAWFRQADAAASSGQIPTVAFQCDEEILACLRFTDLVDLVAEIKQLEAQVEDLRQPAGATVHVDPVQAVRNLVSAATEGKVDHGARTCRNGHIADEYGYCQDKKCKYRRGYRAPKS